MSTALQFSESGSSPGLTIQPVKLCECGCGQPTALILRNDARHGRVKGQSNRFIQYHQSTRFGVLDPSPNPSELCMCGCGLPAPLATHTRTELGWAKGQPIRFIKGHNGARRDDLTLPVFCQCGCGLPAPIYRGHQMQFLRGHAGAATTRKTKRYEINPVTGCWEWLLAKRDGYGITKGKNGKVQQAHVVEYEKTKGPISVGLVLDHVKCQNRGCINPDHVEPVTNKVNTQRGPVAKINQAIANAMRELYASGAATQKQLSIKYGVSLSLVCDVIHGNTWVVAP